MSNNKKIKKLVGIATLTALVVVLQLISNYVTIGTVNITLALVPIVVGAILYGPLTGLFLGAMMGVMVIVAPSTLAYFMPYNAAATIILCIAKTGLAGLVAGLMYKLFIHVIKNKKVGFAVGVVTATLIAPVINTGLFIFGAALFFQGVYGAENFGTALPVIVAGVFGTNFVIEFVVSAVLSPVVLYIFRILKSNFDLGFSADFMDNAASLATAEAEENKEENQEIVAE